MTTHATLDGFHFPIDPSMVTWDFVVKTSEQNTLGGKVVQVLGTRLGDMTVSGQFVSWQQQQDFLTKVEGWVDKQIQVAKGVGYGAGVSGGQPLRFTFSPRKWDFHVYIKALTSTSATAVSWTAATLAPTWTLTFFIVQDNTNLLRTIQDKFLTRLMDGIGWKQTQYNGPTQDVDATSVRQTMLSQFKSTYETGQ